MNLLGLITALSTFLGIWLGHVSVRSIERRAENLWLPIATALVLGSVFEMWSFFTLSRSLSAATGVFGITLLWDALEFVRQEKRIQRGHAPANLQNPRHMRILEEYAEATTENPFKGIVAEYFLRDDFMEKSTRHMQ